MTHIISIIIKYIIVFSMCFLILRFNLLGINNSDYLNMPDIYGRALCIQLIITRDRQLFNFLKKSNNFLFLLKNITKCMGRDNIIYNFIINIIFFRFYQVKLNFISKYLYCHFC